MPFATGTAASMCELQIAIDTLVTANGWIRLQGEPDIVPASPKAARYWRLVISEVENNSLDFVEMRQLQWRTAVGGANVATNAASYSASESSNSPGEFQRLIDGTAPSFSSADIDDETFKVTYDFGTPTIIREIAITADTTDTQAPHDFSVQWSNDGVTWTAMFTTLDEQWDPLEQKVFTFDDGFVDPRHPSATVCRRTGNNVDIFEDFAENGLFVWQGPGYDAARRVHVGCRTHFNLASNSEWLELRAMTGFSAAENDVNANPGADTVQRLQVLVGDSGGFDYWIYVNSIRIFVVIRNGVADYCSFYLGFLAAFAQPDEWGQPLAVLATQPNFTDVNASVGSYGMAPDPGENGQARYLDWTGVWNTIANRTGSGEVYSFSPAAWVWPWSTGKTGDGAWPLTTQGDNDSFGSHWLDRVDATEQGDLPLLPATVISNEFGNLGALDGVFALPSGGLLAPEQSITVGADTYRVFANRTRRDGHHFFVIRED